MALFFGMWAIIAAVVVLGLGFATDWRIFRD